MRKQFRRVLSLETIREFIRLESASGILLFSFALLALVMDNSPLKSFYDAVVNFPLTLKLGDLTFQHSLVWCVNEGLMTIFFLLVGLEIKRELLEGELNSLAKVSLPGVAALGGMVVPALIYLFYNWGNPITLRGWAIPTATDIAFSLGILSLLGRRVPISLKIFLTALAIFDDVGAILIIAVFYTEKIQLIALAAAGVCLLGLLILNRLRIRQLWPYLTLGVLLWMSVLNSGVHATLAGVAFALAIPLEATGGRREDSLLRKMEHRLHPWVAFLILPIFSFTNAGISFSGIDPALLMSSVPMGIVLGLFVGKQLGVFAASGLALRFGIAKMPTHGTWLSLYGIGLICGVGFTMSLFINGLAFTDIHQPAYAALARFGVLIGSVLSGIAGYWVLRLSCKRLALN